MGNIKDKDLELFIRNVKGKGIVVEGGGLFDPGKNVIGRLEEYDETTFLKIFDIGSDKYTKIVLNAAKESKILLYPATYGSTGL